MRTRMSRKYAESIEELCAECIINCGSEYLEWISDTHPGIPAEHDLCFCDSHMSKEDAAAELADRIIQRRKEEG